MTVHRYAEKERDALDDARAALTRYRRMLGGLTAALGVGLWIASAFLMTYEIVDEDYGWLIAVPGLALMILGAIVGLTLAVSANEASGAKHPENKVRAAQRTYDRAAQAEADEILGGAE